MVVCVQDVYVEDIFNGIVQRNKQIQLNTVL